MRLPLITSLLSTIAPAGRAQGCDDHAVQNLEKAVEYMGSSAADYARAAIANRPDASAAESRLPAKF